MDNSIWIIGEQSNGALDRVSFELLNRGRQLANQSAAKLTAIVLADKISDQELQKLAYYGADCVIVIENPSFREFAPDPWVNNLLHLIKKYQPGIVIAAATSTGRTVMPAVAVLCPTGLTADCTGLEIDSKTGNLNQTRPAIGGNILATIVTPNHRPQMATVRPHSAQPLDPDFTRTALIQRETPPEELNFSRTKKTGFRPILDETAHLAEATVAVCAGKGFKKRDNLKLAEEIAHLLDGAIGATREAVDLGWLPYSAQVGLSGKTINPKLYIGAGLSGTVQHLAGMKTAEKIVAINTDPESQILKVADLGINGNLLDVLPELISEIKKRKSDKLQSNNLI